MNVASTILRTIEELPVDVREAMGVVHIEICKRPSKFHLSIGVTPDQMACFAKATEEYGEEPGTSWIVVFTDNITPLDEARVTLVMLHELAHALGMDEHEVRALGLGPEVIQCH
jgi:predicted Zn-dependent protease with MMP-like domain